jgi:hypothetical protein
MACGVYDEKRIGVRALHSWWYDVNQHGGGEDAIVQQAECRRLAEEPRLLTVI